MNTLENDKVWETALRELGVPVMQLPVARRLAQLMSDRLASTSDWVIEERIGVGDYTRGLCILAAAVSIEWLGSPSA